MTRTDFHPAARSSLAPLPPSPDSKISEALNVRPEAELMLCCTRTYMNSETAERIRALLREDIDWGYLFRTARRNGIIPLLHWHLNSTFPDAAPAATLSNLRDYSHNNANLNLFLTGELIKLLNLLEANGIPAVPYKGPALAASVYRNLALRESGDLDLFVHSKDVFKIRDLLRAYGYRPEHQLTQTQEAAYLQTQYEYNLNRHDVGIHLEIHWQFVPRYFCFPFGAEHLWDRLESVSLAGTKVLSFSHEDLLLILCVHGSSHCWERLGWICDVAELIGLHQEMDWERVMENAGTLGSERNLFLGLYLANHLLRTDLPKVISQRMQADRVIRSLAAQVCGRLLQDGYSPRGILESCRFHLRAKERWRDRLRFAVDLAMTPNIRDRTILPLPAPLYPIYLVLRPIRLTGKYSRRFWKQLLS